MHSVYSVDKTAESCCEKINWETGELIREFQHLINSHMLAVLLWIPKSSTQ